MGRKLNVDRMRRLPQRVQEAEARRAAREQWDAAAATPLGRMVLGIAEALTQVLRPRPVMPLVPGAPVDLHIPHIPPLHLNLERLEQLP